MSGLGVAIVDSRLRDVGFLTGDVGVLVLRARSGDAGVGEDYTLFFLDKLLLVCCE